MNGVSGTLSGAATTYMSAIGYAENGNVAQVSYPNGRYEQRCYNARQQVEGIVLRTAPTVACADTANNEWKLSYGYAAGANNGNVASQTVGDGASWSVMQAYSYDKLNRLEWAEEAGVNGGAGWKRTFGYDRWGNQWVVATASYGLVADAVTPNGVAWITAKNRLALASGGYDRAGNQTRIPPYTVSYDADNHATALVNGAATLSYAYDGRGRRVKKVNGSLTTVYVYDALGQLAAEYVTGTPPAGAPAPVCTTCWVATDMLGSTRVLWDEGGVKARYDYLPNGETIPVDRNRRETEACGVGATGCYAGDGSLAVRFTGMLRDAETASSAMSNGLDYFGARYFSAAQGRMTSPDPFMIMTQAENREQLDAYLSNPQNWNRYAYALNNPALRRNSMNAKLA